MPTYANGKICYIEIPSADPEASSAFYAAAFGWNMRRRGNGSLAFDDGVGEVSGSFVTGRPASGVPGLLVYVMVDNVAATMEKVRTAGGQIVQEIGKDSPEITARFADPAGNVMGLYQEPG